MRAIKGEPLDPDAQLSALWCAPQSDRTSQQGDARQYDALQIAKLALWTLFLRFWGNPKPKISQKANKTNKKTAPGRRAGGRAGVFY